jgi:hypothetical protein
MISSIHSKALSYDQVTYYGIWTLSKSNRKQKDNPPIIVFGELFSNFIPQDVASNIKDLSITDLDDVILPRF